MSAGFNAAISSVTSPRLAPSIVSFLILLNFVKWSKGLRLTNMKVPLIADLREELELDCKFDMGSEQLYAVKWYKDDQEFFRFMPLHDPNTISFPVAGVHLVPDGKDCSVDHCKVRLRGLTRHHSGGAYRCEISSEAPAFRLASETHNVTVAALPRQNPRIEGLTTSYVENDIVQAKCISDPADPGPILSWFINGLQAPSKTVGEMTSSEPDKMGLVSRSLSLRFPVERKHSRGDSMELRCVASLPGIPMSPQVTTHTVPLRIQPTQVVNNEKLHWYSNAGIKNVSRYVIYVVLLFCVIK